MKFKIVAVVLGVQLLGSTAFAATDSVGIIREGLLGAGVGAISAGASGGKAGQGALIGAGTSVIGNALMALLTGSRPQQPAYTQPVYTQPAYTPPPQAVYQQPVYQTVQVQQPVYTYRTDPVYIQQPAYYSYPSQQDYSKKVLRNGLLGAGVGAISAEASGGKAGKGALIGAGTNVLGSALSELLFE